jgi:hypothetical protein
MSKEQTIVKLAGYISHDQLAQTHNADQVSYFCDEGGQFIVKGDGDDVYLQTHKDGYNLKKHPSIQNLYTGICAGTKVHFTKKKLVGKLIYWS